MARGEDRNERQQMYAWYQQKGLPVPEKYLSQEERHILAKRRDYYKLLEAGLPAEQFVVTEEEERAAEAKAKAAKPITPRPFDPQISMSATSIPGLTQENGQGRRTSFV